MILMFYRGLRRRGSAEFSRLPHFTRGNRSHRRWCGLPLAVGTPALNKGWGITAIGIPATQVDIGPFIAGAASWANSLARGPDGSLYFDAYRNICRVMPDGVISFTMGATQGGF
jgi:hypothetical protein